MSPSPANRSRLGFSLPEILSVIAIIGVLAAIAIPAYSGLNTKAKDVEADDFVESLNRACSRYVQANWDFPTAANNGATTDEFIVLHSLQYAWPKRAMKAGSPYFSTIYKPAVSSDSTKHRIRWNGRTFDLLKPGTSGSGLLKMFDGSDQKDCEFPPGFLPAGMQSGYAP